MPLVWVIWLIIGAVMGSFLNVCIYRLPREQSIVRPRSHCPHCQHLIAWYDNIPILSYVVLGGRCRHCRAGIHWRYPLVEALSALAAVAVLARFGLGAQGIVYLVLIWALLAASFIDLDFQIIPDEISLGGLAVGLLISPLVPQLHGTDQALTALTRSFVGALVGSGVLYATGTIGNWMLLGLRHLGVQLRHRPFWRKALARYRHMRDTMGGGDVKLLAMAGSVLGWKLVLLTFLLAPVVAILPGLIVLCLHRSNVIPYGPFLSLGLVVSMFWGEEIIAMTGIASIAEMFWIYYGWGV